MTKKNPTPERVNLGKEIRRLREELSITQEELAGKLHTGQQEVSRIELGYVDIGLDKFDEISQVLKVEKSELIKHLRLPDEQAGEAS